MKLRRFDMVRMLDECQNHVVRNKIEYMIAECDRVYGECQRRRATLNKMFGESRDWENLRAAMSSWLTDMQERYFRAS